MQSKSRDERSGRDERVGRDERGGRDALSGRGEREGRKTLGRRDEHGSRTAGGWYLGRAIAVAIAASAGLSCATNDVEPSPKLTYACKATFFDGQGGNVLGEKAVELELEAGGDVAPEKACLHRVVTPKEAPALMMVTRCECEEFAR
jgi:hypothetical protein